MKVYAGNFFGCDHDRLPFNVQTRMYVLIHNWSGNGFPLGFASSPLMRIAFGTVAYLNEMIRGSLSRQWLRWLERAASRPTGSRFAIEA